VKIAVIGAGIAGNVAAWHLCRRHEVTVFEAGSHVGGHTHTHEVEQDGRHYAVDTGFIVYNDWTYPNFVRLLEDLGVASQDSSMSFSVRDERSGLEYNGTSLNGLFAQRANVLRPSFLRMLRDIVRFNREAPGLLAQTKEPALGEYLRAERYGRHFIEHYLIPMGAAIWSTDPALMLAFPARYFVRFLHNHGMLSVNARPQWRVIQGGSARYVEKLTAPFRDRIRLNAPIAWVRRMPGHVLIKPCEGEIARFDAVFLACHSDQALALLRDATAAEREVLGAIGYQRNEAVLHTDTALMPRSRRAWAAWNYHLPDGPRHGATLTYNMNILQSLDAPRPFLVTLNRSDAIDERHVIRRIAYDHPLYTPAAVAAQARHHEINGVQRTWFCGAYWGFGFHEDGVVSALKALEHFERHGHAQRALSRAS
jgi:predicted NAD/FAD-binding protein